MSGFFPVSGAGQPGGPKDDETKRRKFEPKIAAASMEGLLEAAETARRQGGKGFLHVYSGSAKGATAVLGSSAVAIGRDKEKNVLPIDDTGASHVHCEVRAAGGAFEVVDLGSKNGTFVNGSRVDKARKLSSGDVLSIGDVRIYVGIL